MRYLFIVLVLNGCAYRYDTATFVADERKAPHEAETVEPIPCPEAKSTIEVKNTLDSKTNTITTTASSTHSRTDSCFH